MLWAGPLDTLHRISTFETGPERAKHYFMLAMLSRKKS